MNNILILGYKNQELGIFSENDPKITVIKKAIRQDLIRLLEEGVCWFTVTGNLGFEYWSLQVLKELAKEYPIKIATIFDFETHGQNWKAENQEKLALFKEVDFIKYAYPQYDNPSQFKVYNRFLIDNSDGAYLFYDEENETNLNYIYSMIKNETDYEMLQLDFERLNEIAQEF